MIEASNRGDEVGMKKERVHIWNSPLGVPIRTEMHDSEWVRHAKYAAREA
jgi:hypothetical protein